MDWGILGQGIIDTVIYSVVGILMMTIGFLFITLLTPFSVKKEIEDDQNTSLGIIIGAVIIGIAIIVGSVISAPSGNVKVIKKIKTVETKKDKK